MTTTTTETLTGTFTKFDGTWMVRVTGTVPAPTAADLGIDVEVAKRDGTVKIERISRVAEFTGEGFSIHSMARDLGRKAQAHQRADRRGDLLDIDGDCAVPLSAEQEARIAARLAR